MQQQVVELVQQQQAQQASAGPAGIAAGPAARTATGERRARSPAKSAGIPYMDRVHDVKTRLILDQDAMRVRDVMVTVL